MLGSFSLSNVYVSKGFEENPAVRYAEKDGEVVVASFGLSGSVYDKKAENNKKYINFTGCKAFGKMAQRIQKMKVDSGANVNVSGHFDSESWEDKETNKKRTALTFIIDNIEYNGSGKKKDGEASAETPTGIPYGSTSSVETDDAFDDLPF